MPELHLKHLGLTYSARGPVTKYREKIWNFRKKSNLKHSYRS